jgi:AcrR family transcriptional regulator
VLTESATKEDGRRLRGAASREAILDAASQVILRDGVASLTHRAVAESAGVPLARVSYHYPRVEDLMVAASLRYLAVFDERLGLVAADALAGRRSVVEATTDFLFDLVTAQSAEFLAMVEVRLALQRRGHAVDGDGVVDVIGAFGVDTPHAISIVAAMFGFAVLAATSPRRVTRDDVRSHVRTILEAGR